MVLSGGAGVDGLRARAELRQGAGRVGRRAPFCLGSMARALPPSVQASERARAREGRQGGRSALGSPATRNTSSPVRGSSTGKVRPDRASTHWPPIHSCAAQGQGIAGDEVSALGAPRRRRRHARWRRRRNPTCGQAPCARGSPGVGDPGLHKHARGLKPRRGGEPGQATSDKPAARFGPLTRAHLVGNVGQDGVGASGTLQGGRAAGGGLLSQGWRAGGRERRIVFVAAWAGCGKRERPQIKPTDNPSETPKCTSPHSPLQRPAFCFREAWQEARQREDRLGGAGAA